MDTLSPDRPHLRYMPGLDGLRALALLGVMAYHWQFGFASGGFLGVSLFFVLSGYLITDILASQWHRNRRIDLRDFWIRRIKRLTPAMLLTLFMIVIWITLFDRARLSELRNDVLGAVTYISNWQFIFEQKSYFELFGPPSPLGHFWSLAVEEQFYLLWPIIMMLALRFLPRRWQLVSFILAGAALSALAMALIYQPGTDPSRVYFGTDTRAFGLLIGAALAIIWPSGKLSYISPSRAARSWLNVIGGLSMLIILLMFWKTERYDPAVYQGGMVGFSIAAAVLVAVLAHPASVWGRLLSWKPLRWIGIRSYGIYLWHYPVMILTSPPSGPGQLSTVEITLQILASVVLAAISYTYVEVPIRRGRIKALWFTMKGRGLRSIFTTLRGSLTSLCLLGLLAIFCYGIITSVSYIRTTGDMAAWLPISESVVAEPANSASPADKKKGAVPEPQRDEEHPLSTGHSDEKPITNNNEGSSSATGGNVSLSPSATLDKASDEGTDDGNTDDGNTEPPQTSPSAVDEADQSTPPIQEDLDTQDEELPAGEEPSDHPHPNAEPPSENSGNGASDKTTGDSETKPSKGHQPKAGNQESIPTPAVSAIGDSVMLGVAPYLEKSIPGIYMDAEIGRQLRQTEKLLPQLQEWGRIDGGIVVIGLGTNGSFTPKELDSLLSSLAAAKQVVLVNTHVPRDWEQQVNRLLAQAAADYPNVTLADWFSASKGHPEYFYEDGVHLRPEGAAAYTSLLMNTIKQ